MKRAVLALCLGLAIGLLASITSYFAGFFPAYYWVRGFSMFPSLENNGGVIIDTRFSHLDRLDIVAFEFDDRVLCKRVIGLPGETVYVFYYYIYIINKDNVFELDEPYLFRTFLYDPPIQQIDVPEGYICVLGDNRAESYDSRTFGCIPISNVIGYVLWVL